MTPADRGSIREEPPKAATSDDDDWVGTPPEGRHSRDKANPGYWNRSWPVAAAAGAGLLVLVVIVVILAAT